MKKKLETDLVSIAHKILQLKNKSDINVLFLETQKLYEKLTLLKFIEEHLGDTKPTISQHEAETKIEEIFNTLENKEQLEDIAPQESVLEAILNNDQEIPQPQTTQNQETKPHKQELLEISFEEFIINDHTAAQFVKIEDIEPQKNTLTNLSLPPYEQQNTPDKNKNQPKTVNDQLAKNVAIDLNDSLGFIKHLFANSSEDYNRVLSQINTFDTFNETRAFIEEIVKPDYNNWQDKDEYAFRFLEIIEKKFL